MNDFTMRSEPEAKTYELLHNYTSGEWNQEALIIASVFRSCWTQALMIDRLCSIAGALHAMIINQEAIEAELKKMVKAKVLRKRKTQGKVFWEVNY